MESPGRGRNEAPVQKPNHRGGRRRPQLQHRPKTADLPGPSAGPQEQGTHFGRGHVEHGSKDGRGHAEGDQEALRGLHGDHDCASVEHGAGFGQGVGHGLGQGAAIWPPQGVVER